MSELTRLQKTINVLEERINKARDEIMEERRAHLRGGEDDLFGDGQSDEELDAIILDSEDTKFIIDSEAHFRAIKGLINLTGVQGQQMLLAMWRAKEKMMYRAVKESGSVHDALAGFTGDNTDTQYVKAMLQVVEVFSLKGESTEGKQSIFEYVHHREQSGEPVKDEKGRALTLSEEDDEFHVNLISSLGMISKLKENAYHFSHRLETDEERDQLLAAIGSGKSREYVKAVKQKQKSDAAPAQIKVKETDAKDGMIKIEFKTTSFLIEPGQWRKLKKRLEGILDFEL